MEEEALLIVFVMVGRESEGVEIARRLVDEGLAACVNIVPAVRSIYRWEERMEDAGESLLVIKTGKGHIEDLKKRVKEMHSYRVPEIIALPVVGGLEEYLEWVRGELRKSRTRGESGSP